MKAFLLILALAQAIDYCIPGSDSSCLHLGANFCCARITHDTGEQYHACAEISSIEYSENQFKAGNYRGTWECSGAKWIGFSLTLLLSLTFNL